MSVFVLHKRPSHFTEMAESLVRILAIRSVCVASLLQLLYLLQSYIHTVAKKLSTGAQHWQALFMTLSAVSAQENINGNSIYMFSNTAILNRAIELRHFRQSVPWSPWWPWHVNNFFLLKSIKKIQNHPHLNTCSLLCTWREQSVRSIQNPQRGDCGGFY